MNQPEVRIGYIICKTDTSRETNITLKTTFITVVCQFKVMRVLGHASNTLTVNYKVQYAISRVRVDYLIFQGENLGSAMK